MTGQLIRINTGDLEKVDDPKVFFAEERGVFTEIVGVVRRAFGSEMTEEDIFEHLTQPEKVFLLRCDENLAGMFGFTQKKVFGRESLYIDGIAIDPTIQGSGIFQEVVSQVHKGETFVSLKTQSPRMYRALQKFCNFMYPNRREATPPFVFNAARELGFEIDRSCVLRDNYGKALHCPHPYHPEITDFFDKDLQVNYEAGDSVFCLGVKAKKL